MTEKRFTHKRWYNKRQLFDGEEPFAIVDVYNQADKICGKLNELHEENTEIKNDEKQLSIDFLGYKLKLKKILQKRYAYADEQCQKNLNNPIIYRVYDMIRYDVKKLAEEMGVD